MALYRGTALVSQIIGKLGTQDFMRWKNLLVVRMSPVTVTNPNTSRQQDVRAAFTAGAQAWRQSLTDEQRAAWDTFAKSKDRFIKLPSGSMVLGWNNGGTFTGFNAYVGNATQQLSRQMGAVDNPPLTASPLAIPSDLTYAWNVGTSLIDITWTQPADYQPGDCISFWIASQQGLFFEQVASATDLSVEAATITSVSDGADGFLPLTDFSGSNVLLQAAITRATGKFGARSKTDILAIP